MAPAKSTALATPPSRYSVTMEIKSPADLIQLAGIFYSGGASSLQGVSSPNHVARIIMAGSEVGLSPAQSLDTIMMCNGRTTIYGDGAMALIMASGLLVKIKEWIEGEGDNMVAKATIQRQGLEEETFQFSAADAKQMDLWNNPKKDNWKKDPKGMLTWRCRSRWQRGRFADVLRGLNLYEVAADDVVNTTAVEVKQVFPAAASPEASTQAASPPPPPALPAASTAPVSLAAASDPSTSPITDEQKNEVKFLKDRFVTAIGESDAEVIRTKWVELLGEYGVDSALKFTAAQAAKFIDEVGKKYDPFGHPSSGSKT